MNKTSLLNAKSVLAVAGVSAIALAGCGSNNAGGDETVELTIAEGFPETHVISQNVTQRFVDEVEERSAGEISFTRYSGEQLGSAAEMLDLLGGAADVTFLGAAYLSDSLPLSTVATLPGVYEDAVSGAEPWHELVTGTLAEEEYSNHNAIPLASLVMNQYQLITADTKIQETSDIEGLRIRTSGGYQEATASALGGVPVSMSGPEMYQAFQRGTINSSFLTTDSMDPYDIQAVTDFATDNLALGGFPGVYAIDESTFEGLSTDHQELLVEVGREVSLEFGETMREYQTEMEEQFTEEGFEIYSAPAGVVEDVEAVSDDVRQDWVQDMEGRGLSGEKVLNEFMESSGLAD